jgi:transposase
MKLFDAVRMILTTQLTDRDIAEAAGLSKSAVNRYRHTLAEKALTWPQLVDRGPLGVRALLQRPRKKGGRVRTPDLALLDADLQGKGMALKDWWQDYALQRGKTGVSYSHLAAKLQAFRTSQKCVMRQDHTPGERAFVDYSGDKPYYTDAKTQKRISVELFVGVLPASALMFAFCTHTQNVADFISAHVAMLEFFGGSPQVLVPDNLKSAVVKVGKPPVLQRNYAEMASHYSIAVLPARPYKPRDKAAVEQSVQLLQKRILMRLRHQRFYSLDEINTAVAHLLEQANNQPMQKSGISRRVRFETIERHALTPLPAAPYAYAEWLTIPKVGKDYHIHVRGHAYSVPHGLIGLPLDVRLTATTVEVLQEGQRVAQHARNMEVGGHTTHKAHQPKAHQWISERTPDGLREWAKSAGSHVLRFVQQHLEGPVPQAGMPACDALRRLAEMHGAVAVNEAVRRAFHVGYPTITTVKRLMASPSKRTGPLPSPAERSSAQQEATSC